MKKITLFITLSAYVIGANLNAKSKINPLLLENECPKVEYFKKPIHKIELNTKMTAFVLTELTVKGVTASAEQTGNLATNASDNNTSTRWAADASLLAEGNTYITFDLGCELSVSQTDIMFFNNGGTTRIYNYKIATSTNGTDFTDAVSQRFSNPATNPASYQIISLGDVTARYVRFYGYYNSQDGGTTVNNRFVSINEVKFFGSTTCPLSVVQNVKEDLKIYPNPANTELLNLKYKSIIGEVKIVDVTGKVLINTEIDTLNGQINISTLSSGTYFVKVLGVTRKIIR